jgi:hypothetical protein
MAGTPDIWKIGVTKTPYSAVRGRQKYTWAKFGLTHLYFGEPRDVLWLEGRIKYTYQNLSGKAIQGYGTELFKIAIKQLCDEIDSLIEKCNLKVAAVDLKEPYTASSSGKCPFGIPSEVNADYFLEAVADEVFSQPARPKTLSKRVFLKS